MDGSPATMAPVLMTLVNRLGFTAVKDIVADSNLGWSYLDVQQEASLPEWMDASRFTAVEGVGVAYTAAQFNGEDSWFQWGDMPKGWYYHVVYPDHVESFLYGSDKPGWETTSGNIVW